MAQVITEDVTRFWQAFDHLDAPDADRQVQRLYLDPGTAGLRAFTPGRIDSAENLVTTLRARRAFYESIRRVSLTAIHELAPSLAGLPERLRTLIPDAPDNDVFVVVGALNSGGTIGRQDGQTFAVVGLEFFCLGEATALDDLTPWERSVLRPPSALPGIITHELIHTMQPEVPGHVLNLLLYTLAEGAADYLAGLVGGDVIQPELHAYGLAHEDALKVRFVQDVCAGAGVDAWLYQGTQASREPADLGYFIGAQVMRAYHMRHLDCPDVVRRMLEDALRDPVAFVHVSGYFGYGWPPSMDFTILDK